VGGVQLELKSDLGELGRLADAIEAFADAHGLDPTAAGRLTIALDEVVTNAITHGALAAEAVIAVELTLDGGDIVATVSDPGPAFDPLAAAPAVDIAAPIETRPVGGLGLFICRNLARKLAYTRDGARNRLTLWLAT
jgi:sigma-B regulation protein RsbU (phosphoserine phosphatase)